MTIGICSSTVTSLVEGLESLKEIGISGNLSNLVTGLLCQRKQRDVLNELMLRSRSDLFFDRYSI